MILCRPVRFSSIYIFDIMFVSIPSFHDDLQVYREQISTIQPSGRHKVRVIGYYGVGGAGKTTMCRVLCNELALEFDDKVCHIEMASNPSSPQKMSHLHEVLNKLTRTSEEVLRGLNEGEVRT